MSQTTSMEMVRLGGNWSVIGISEQLPRLVALLNTVETTRPAANPGPENYPLICLAELEEIDTSGWQMLAFYVRHLRRLGFDPALVNVRDDFRRHVELLGFSREFLLTGREGNA